MKKIATVFAAAALLATGSAAVARQPDGEAKLARMLEGRVAGQPKRCINDFRGKDVQIIDRVGIVYNAGGTIWVARADQPESLRDRNLLIVERLSASTLCSHDIKRTVDRYTGALESVVFLGDFVPYTRAG